MLLKESTRYIGTKLKDFGALILFLLLYEKVMRWLGIERKGGF